MNDTFSIVTNSNIHIQKFNNAEAKKYVPLSSGVEHIPSNFVHLDNEEDIKKMNLLLENIDDDDDVQNVWNNWENPEDGEEEE